MFKIEKNIPMEKTSKYSVLEGMDIGDSFLCSSSLVVHFRQYADRHGFKIISRKQDKNEHRIWRVK